MNDFTDFDPWAWCQALAARFGGGVLEVDDLAQEARIAYWQELSKSGSIPFAITAAEYRLRNLVRAERPARMVGAAEKGKPTYEVKHGPSLDTPIEDGGTLADVLDPGVDVDMLEALEEAYHRGVIAQALGELKPEHREYVELRFWHGLDDGKISARMGVPRTTLNNRWKRTIEPMLRKQLDHLRSAA